MSALRYYDLPFEAEAKRQPGFVDRICRRAWMWASARQSAQAARAHLVADPHLLRDIGLTENDLIGR